MKSSEFKELSSDELKQKVVSLKKELFDMRMARSEGKVAEQNKAKRLRKDVARALTALNQKST
jgi:large subunit ribosomal protein L29